jgi:hypothetical protein
MHGVRFNVDKDHDHRSFELRHKESLVDLSVPFRLSGVSLNAALELTPQMTSSSSSSRRDPASVRVCIQQLDGRRAQGNFSCSSTLQSILEQLNMMMVDHTRFGENLSHHYHHSLLFMQREIKSSEYAQTTLQSLGLTSGSAIFRVQLNNTDGIIDIDRRSHVPMTLFDHHASSSDIQVAVHQDLPSQCHETEATTTTAKYALERRHSSLESHIAVSRSHEAKDRCQEKKEEKEVLSPFVEANEEPVGGTDSRSLSGSPAVHMSIAPHNITTTTREEAQQRQQQQQQPRNISSIRDAKDALQDIRRHCFDHVSKDVILILMKIVSNVLTKPGTTISRLIYIYVCRETLKQRRFVRRSIYRYQDSYTTKSVRAFVCMYGWSCQRSLVI